MPGNASRMLYAGRSMTLAQPSSGLPVQDVSSDSPVEQQQLGVGRWRGPLLSSMDPTLEVSQPVGVDVGPA